MPKGSPNLLIVGSGQGLGSFHNAIWWNLAIFFNVQAEIRPSKRWLDRSLAKSLIGGVTAINFRKYKNIKIKIKLLNFYLEQILMNF